MYFTMLAPASNPVLLVPLVLGASSIGTLLLYFYGIAAMASGVRIVLLPAAVMLVLVMAWTKRTGRVEIYDRIRAGLWSGACATLAYDLVRVPIAQSGVPVFKAISYFGTVIVGQASPTVTSEIIGWTYHLSNGIGFGLMYANLVSVPRLWTAVLWSLVLEGAMLVTPYAEIFGYRVSQEFLAMTVGAHVVYGITLWAVLRYWSGWHGSKPSPRSRPFGRAVTCALIPIGMAAIAADFHLRYDQTLPPSPPGYLGPHLYTTWDVLEPDRLAAMWVLKRFVDPKAAFHFVGPFSQVIHGTPFDIPEAAVRRDATRSATQVLLIQNGLDNHNRLAQLSRMAHLYEIMPWRRSANLDAYRLGQELMTAASRCEPTEIGRCVERAFRYLDSWYLEADSKHRGGT
jgi:hypothetical protein